MKKILVAGATGFIGANLVRRLLKEGYDVHIFTRVSSNKWRLTDILSRLNDHTVDLLQEERLEDLVKKIKPDIIFHLAAHVGGIHYNNIHPATLLYRNLLPTLNLLEAAKKSKVARILLVSSACVYPRFCPIPTPESAGFQADPEPTNFGYGWSKRMAEILAKTYHQEFDLKIGIVRPYNVYGPGDNFDPAQSHVIPALVKRICDGEDPLVVWGDGSPTRSFIYVDDVVQGMLLALEKYPQPDPINLGTQEEISIKDLAKLIIKLAKTKTKLQFDPTKPNGQPRRNCDSAKAEKILNFTAAIKLVNGLPFVIT